MRKNIKKLLLYVMMYTGQINTHAIKKLIALSWSKTDV